MTELGIALRRPFTNWPRLLLGILLSSIPGLNFAAIGYLLRCAMQTEDKLPFWHRPFLLWWEGLQASVVGLIYALPALIIMALSTLVASSDSLLATIISFITISVLAATIYVAPAALLSFADDGWRAAFDIPRAAALFWSKSYFRTWLKALLAGLAIGFIAIFFTSAFPFSYVVNVLYGAGLFIGQVVFWTLLGGIRGFSSAQSRR